LFLGVSRYFGARDGIELLATGRVLTGLYWFCAVSVPPNMPPERKVPLSSGRFSNHAQGSSHYGDGSDLSYRMNGPIFPMEIQPGFVRLPEPSLRGIDSLDGSDLSHLVFAELPGRRSHSGAAPSSEGQRPQSPGVIRSIKLCGVGAGLRSSLLFLAAQ